MMKFTVLTILLMISTSTYGQESEASTTAPVEDVTYDSYRLPTSITPENYKLNVVTHLNDTEGFIFRGSVWITVSLLDSCATVKSESKAEKQESHRGTK